MGKDWLVGGKWLWPPRGGGKGDRGAQYQRQLEKRRAGKLKRKCGRPQGPQKRRWEGPQLLPNGYIPRQQAASSRQPDGVVSHHSQSQAPRLEPMQPQHS